MRFTPLLLAFLLTLPAPASDTWFGSLTLREKAAQLVMVPFYGGLPNARTRQYREFQALVSEVRIGGFILLNRVHQGSVVDRKSGV